MKEPFEFFHYLPGIPLYVSHSWLVMLGILGAALAVRGTMALKPTGFANLIESILDVFVGLLDEAIGSRGRDVFPIIAALGLYILFGNWLGLIPGFGAPTGNINTTNVSNTDTTLPPESVNPSVENLTITPASPNQYDDVNVTVRVTDNVAVDTVLLFLVRPDNTNNTFKLNGTNGNYSKLFSALLPGSFNITIIANDTSGNTNGTVKTSFVAGEQEQPKIHTVTFVPNPGNISMTNFIVVSTYNFLPIPVSFHIDTIAPRLN